MFYSDFVALTGNHTRNFVARHKLCFNGEKDFKGENQTCNFVARHKLGFNATSSLCLGIELVGARVRVRVRVWIPRQIRHSSDTAPAQLRHRSATKSDTKSATDPPQTCHKIR